MDGERARRRQGPSQVKGAETNNRTEVVGMKHSLDCKTTYLRYLTHAGDWEGPQARVVGRRVGRWPVVLIFHWKSGNNGS